MGMREYKKFKREQELKESETISLLIKEVEELKARVSSLEAVLQAAPKLSEDEKKKIKVLQDKKTKPEDFISMFTGDLEEFNPNA